ncbi:MAG: acyltransferase [Sphingomonadaceae bacterium]|nr:acyltransferase [Sphingomonadaceae bacterium]
MQTSARFDHIDMLRGLAALLVCVGHIRGMIWVDYGALAAPDAVTKILYFLTGLGHQAVVLFFALSGFLVGGSAFQRIRSGQFNGGDYLLRRLTRLWTVLLPALALGALWDWLGRDILAAPGYDGSLWPILSSGPDATRGIDLSLSTLLGNILFLQTIFVPTFGSNGPLWSLANEFFYYLLFPAMALAAFGRTGWPMRLAAGLFAIIVAVILPQVMLLLGLIWLAGALVWPLGNFAAANARRCAIWAAGGLVLLIAGMVWGRSHPGLGADLLLGGITALWLPALARLRGFGRFYAKLSKALSEISYTLYVVHFPILFLLASLLFLPRQMAPDAMGLVWLVGATIFALFYAACIWRMFERNTDAIRRWLQARFWPINH